MSINTLLLSAIKQHDIDKIAILLQNPDRETLTGEKSALVVALEQNNEKAANLLIKGKYHIDETGLDGKTPLIISLEKGMWRTAYKLIKADVDIDKPGADNKPPIIIAMERNQDALVELLIKKGADLNQTGPDNKPALMIGLEQKKEYISRILIEHGADLNKTGPDNKPPLIAAIELNNNPNGNTLAMEMLKANVDLNACGPDKYPAVCKAINRGDIHLAHALVKNGANCALKGPDGKNALDLAIELGKDRLALNIKKYRTFATSNLARHSLMQKRANAKEKYAYYAQRLEEEERFQETLKKEVVDLPNESFLRKAYAKIANVQDEIVKTTRTVRDEWKKLALKDKLKQGKLCTLRKRNAYLNKQISKSRETSTKRKTLEKEREVNTANIRKLEENLPMVVSRKHK
ncbi:MAG: ankyrin repeat domain-containing protein [Pseudomonadota bacterium]|nr:ankyrin repeat domain-containing protein [Pseudomonadota bacterium]